MPSPLAVTIIGAGPAGALLATLLAQSGLNVEVFDKRADPEFGASGDGRSINLALAERGLHALRQAGIADAIVARSVMMRGRIVHTPDHAPELLRYGPDDREVLWSVERHALSRELCRAARQAGARFYFGHALHDVDFDRQQLQLRDPSGQILPHPFSQLIGADGAGSQVRAAIQAQQARGESWQPLGHGYKELEIPPTGDPQQPFALEAHGLHIWPRQAYMSIALPNHDGSFTVTLFLSHQGPGPNFEALQHMDDARQLFAAQFPDLLALMPDFDRDFASHPVGQLGTLHLDSWHLDHRAVLLGDAAHAMVPFHGQGMNCALEDAVALAELLRQADPADHDLFARFQQQRKPQADAIAAMALENYVEMRDSVTDPGFRARRQLALELAARAPQHFMPRYRMVTFTRLPYAYAFERGALQDVWVEQLLQQQPDLARIDLDAAAEATRQHLPALPDGLWA